MRRTLRAGLKTIVLVPAFFLVTIALAALVLTLAWRDADDPRIERVIQWWSERFLALAPVDSVVHGAEKIDPERRYVFVANHLSNFDIPLLLRAIPERVRFLAKKELYKIPVFGQAMDKVGIVKIDRTRAMTAHEAINAAAREVLGRGYSLIVFPEGTRSRTGEMQRFKKGAFRIAIDNQVPIVPVVLEGTQDVWPPGAKVFYPGSASVTILDPIETTGRAGNVDIGELTELTRARMLEVYEQQRSRRRRPSVR